MLIETAFLTLTADKEIIDSATTLRGFIADSFPTNPLLHHHFNNPGGEKQFIYSYPKIQYKIINGTAVILGIGEAVQIVKDISNIGHLNLRGKKYTVIEKKTIEKKMNFGVIEKMQQYEFITPWLALDEDSYARYRKRNQQEKEKQLESILIGNILSMSKGLEYVVTDELQANIIKIKEVKTKLKGVPMLGFLGNFSVNFEIPDYWGIGKSVSRGFGTVIRQKQEDRGQKQ